MTESSQFARDVLGQDLSVITRVLLRRGGHRGEMSRLLKIDCIELNYCGAGRAQKKRKGRLKVGPYTFFFISNSIQLGKNEADLPIFHFCFFCTEVQRTQPDFALLTSETTMPISEPLVSNYEESPTPASIENVDKVQNREFIKSNQAASIVASTNFFLYSVLNAVGQLQLHYIVEGYDSNRLLTNGDPVSIPII